MFCSGVENYFRSREVAVDGFDGVFHDVLNAKGGSHMKDGVGFCDEFVDEFFVADIALVNGDFAFEVSDVLFRASGKVVQDCDAIATGDEGIGEVRADETGTTGDESAHGRESIFYVGLLSGGSGFMQVVLRKVGEA